jgi:hypothetical protein
LRRWSSQEGETVSRSLKSERERLRRAWSKIARIVPLRHGKWRYSRRLQSGDPAQGWKIHLSATLRSAQEVFSLARPILRHYGVLYKVPARLEFLVTLNSGLGRFSQIGKFLTAYPRSDAEAVALARELHKATQKLEGPKVPFDVPYRKQSIVSYRYGAFLGTGKNGGDGTIVDPQGRTRSDRRDRDHAVPRWLEDPFARDARTLQTRLPEPFGTDLLPLRTIAKRGKGSVYQALDLSVLPPRVVIVKEGLRHGESNWLGLDGFAQVKREGMILRQIRQLGAPVPAAFREFTKGGNRYLVLELIRGRRLLPRGRIQPKRKSWKFAEGLLGRISPALNTIHSAGYVWRDCKPEHIFLRGGAISFVDFEGACRIDEVNAHPWATSAYSPPCYHRAMSRRPGTLEDDYALGVILFQFGAGKFPPTSARSRAVIYKRTNCPATLRKKIELLLKQRKVRRLVK